MWINSNKLSGTLTEYPVDIGVFEWAVGNQYFSPSNTAQTSPEFVQKFSSASQQHYHFEDGRSEGE